MKWAAPAEGAIRERVKFAWYPVPCDDGVTRWLERVIVREQFQYQGDPFNGSWYAWMRISARPENPNG
jgi:hypothetical protein